MTIASIVHVDSSRYVPQFPHFSLYIFEHPISQFSREIHLLFDTVLIK